MASGFHKLTLFRLMVLRRRVKPVLAGKLLGPMDEVATTLPEASITWMLTVKVAEVGRALATSMAEKMVAEVEVCEPSALVVIGPVTADGKYAPHGTM